MTDAGEKSGHDRAMKGASIAEAAGRAKGRGPAPVHLWNPPYCGEMDLEILPDGRWIHEGSPIGRPEMVRLFASVLKREGDRFFLVTDAMPPVGTDATSFELYGQRILRRDGRLVTEDGTLAGADIDMASAVRNCVHMLGLPLEEALAMASLHPAEFLRLDGRLGRLAQGYRADLVLLGQDLEVLKTWVGGE